MDQRTLPEVRDGLGDTAKGLRQFRAPFQRFGMGRGSLGEVWDGSEDSLGDPSRVGSFTKVLNGSTDLPGGLGWFEVPSGRSGMGWGTIPEVQDRSGDPSGLQHGSKDFLGGQGRVGGPSQRFEMD